LAQASDSSFAESKRAKSANSSQLGIFDIVEKFALIFRMKSNET
jgi:hypothetical protein